MKVKKILMAFVVILTTLYAGVVQAQHNPSEMSTEGKITSTGAWIPDNVQELEVRKLGPFVRLADGSILTVEARGTKSLISEDEGKTWEEYPIFSEPDNFAVSRERALIRAKSGVVILAFMNLEERANWNWDEEILDSPDAVLPTYAVRSLDGGKTWEDPQKLHDDWTGAVRDMIETREGNVIFTSMMMRHNPGHHATVTYTTKDEGKTWLRSNVIDLGGVGHHSGVIEATIEQLRDGRIWMLMRTNWGKFWEAYSEDEGLTWKNFGATDIKAGEAPGLLKRLQSGRLVLVWTRPYPEGENDYRERGGDGQFSEVAHSSHREEVSMMFSDDDGESWTKPVVISKSTERMKTNAGFFKGEEITYPYVFEAEPGELWITFMRGGGLGIKLYEKDFVQK